MHTHPEKRGLTTVPATQMFTVVDVIAAALRKVKGMRKRGGGACEILVKNHRFGMIAACSPFPDTDSFICTSPRKTFVLFLLKVRVGTLDRASCML